MRRRIMPLMLLLGVALVPADSAPANPLRDFVGFDEIKPPPQKAKPTLADYERTYIERRNQVIKRFGLRKAGRNLVRDGAIVRHRTVDPAPRKLVEESSTRMDVWLHPAKYAPEPSAVVQYEDATQVVTSDGTVPTATTGTVAPESIAMCESGGDPTAVSADGTYRGKWQFDHGTWVSVGGSGDPAAAPEAEQDYRAGLLYQRSGSSPWPNCG